MLGYDARATTPTDLAAPTAVVIASHGGPEAEMIRAALDAGVGYIGLVASQVRGASILDQLELTDAERARVHTPVGLPIGAKTPAEIAVSIVAEVIRAIRVDGLATSGHPIPAATGEQAACHGHGSPASCWPPAVRAGWARPNRCLPYRRYHRARGHPRRCPRCRFDQLIVTLGGAADAGPRRQ